MNVTELRDALNALIEQGHGDLPATFFHANSASDEYHVDIAGAALVHRWGGIASTHGATVVELHCQDHLDDGYLAERKVR